MIYLNTIIRSAVVICLGIACAAQVNAAPFEVEGSTAGDKFGFSTDCHADKVLVGVPGKAGPSAEVDVGEVQIYNGSGQSLQTIPFPSTPISGENFGHAVSYINDIDGDNGTDIIIGSPGEVGVGAVHVYSTADTSAPYYTFYGIETGEKLGFSATGLPDLTSDGLAEFAVGAPDRGAGAGVVEILNAQSGTPISTLSGSGGDQFGHAVANGGNINGTTPSVIIGAPGGNSGDGEVYLFELSTFTEIGLIDGTQTGHTFGYSVARVPDVDGDGVSEILVGSPRLADTQPGAAYLYSGASVANGSPNRLCRLQEGEAGSLFGFSVKSVGDINGDGAADFAVGSPNSDDIAFNATTNKQGAVYIYTYRSDIGACPLLVGVGGFEQVGKEFGTSIAGGQSCNYNNDVFNDFIVGTKSDTNGADAGSIAIYDGSEFDTGPSLTDVKLKFKISRTGQFVGIIDVDADPVGRGCRATILGRAQQGDVVGDIFQLGSSDLEGLENNIMVDTRLPKSLIINGEKPILHLIARVDCTGRSTHYSNVFARYMNCSCDAGLNAGQWVDEFQDRAGDFDLEDNSRSSVQSSSRVKRMIRKLRRKKKGKRKKKKRR